MPLYDPRRIAVTTIGEFTYALVPSSDPHGVVIMNITNPENPTLVIAIKDKESGGDYDILQGVEDIAIINTDGLVYALVTADDNDNGIQIMILAYPWLIPYSLRRCTSVGCAGFVISNNSIVHLQGL